MNSGLEFFLPLDNPSVFEANGAEISTIAHWNRISFLLLISTNSIEPIFIRFDVERIDYLPDFVDDFFRSLIDKDLFADFFTQSLFYRSDC